MLVSGEGDLNSRPMDSCERRFTVHCCTTELPPVDKPARTRSSNLLRAHINFSRARTASDRKAFRKKKKKKLTNRKMPRLNLKRSMQQGTLTLYNTRHPIKSSTNDSQPSKPSLAVRIRGYVRSWRRGAIGTSTDEEGQRYHACW